MKPLRRGRRRVGTATRRATEGRPPRTAERSPTVGAGFDTMRKLSLARSEFCRSADKVDRVGRAPRPLPAPRVAAALDGGLADGDHACKECEDEQWIPEVVRQTSTSRTRHGLNCQEQDHGHAEKLEQATSQRARFVRRQASNQQGDDDLARSPAGQPDV